jgi:hypothetical protein
MTTAPTTQATQSEITELRMRQVEDQMYLNGLLEEIGYIQEDLMTEMSEADRTYYEHALANQRVRAYEVRKNMLLRLKVIG